jgi:hypothetical protein
MSMLSLVGIGLVFIAGGVICLLILSRVFERIAGRSRQADEAQARTRQSRLRLPDWIVPVLFPLVVGVILLVIDKFWV